MEDQYLAAILAAPADVNARLRYADWLDAQADARGRYLQAEVDAFQSATQDVDAVVTRLTELSNELDPVWVARISRPPMGVCSAHVQFADLPRRIRPQLEPSSFARLDEWMGSDWPAAYRAFLLNQNGGAPNPCQFDLPNGQHRSIAWLYSIWSPDGEPEDFDLDLVAYAQDQIIGSPPWYGPGIGIPADCIKIGTYMDGEGDALCLAWTGERRGQVCSVMPAMGKSAPPPDDQPIVTPIAGSFPEFLLLLH